MLSGTSLRESKCMHSIGNSEPQTSTMGGKRIVVQKTAPAALPPPPPYLSVYPSQRTVSNIVYATIIVLFCCKEVFVSFNPVP